MFENRRWLVIPTEEVKNIDFNQVHESSIDSLRYSVDGTKTFIKYEVNVVLEDITNTYINTMIKPIMSGDTVTTEIPTSGETITTVTKAGVYGRPSIYKEEYPEYNHEDILALLATEEWSKPMEINSVEIGPKI